MASICPVTPREKAQIAFKIQEDILREHQSKVDDLSARLFGLQRQLEDLPIAQLGQQTRAIAEVVMQLEQLRLDLPALVGIPVA